MRLHIEWWSKKQPHMRLDREIWDRVAARHAEAASRLAVTVGKDLEETALYTDAEILITQIVDKERLKQIAPRLKWVFATSAGIDNLLPLDWLPSGVVFSNNSGTHVPKFREFFPMALMMLHMRLPALGSQQRERRWQQLYSGLIGGKTVCIVGFGAMGAAAAEVAKGMGLKVRAVRRSPVPDQRVPDPRAVEMFGVDRLHDALAGADFLVILAPLTPDTEGLIGANELDCLAPGASVLNVGRGPVLDNAALCERLDSGRLEGAMIDVFTPEPLPPESPLWQQKNLLITPHMSSDDPATYIQRSLDIFFEELARFEVGEPLHNSIDPVTGY